VVKRLACTQCETSIEGAYDLPLLASLDAGDQDFIAAFVEASGSLKEMASLLGVSYPTVRNRLDEIIGRLATARKEQESGSET
jgi:hypothetical protein